MTKPIGSDNALQNEVATLTEVIEGLRTEVGQGFRDIETSLSLGEMRSSRIDRELSSLERHVRGLDSTMRDGFAQITALLTRERRTS